MMDTFELSRNRRAKVWLDEAPPAQFTATSTVTKLVVPKLVIASARKIAAVELNIPHGPNASYALLGAELVNSDAEGLEVIVSINSTGVRFFGSLALQPDNVIVGLSDEYASAVVTGIEKQAEFSGLPTKAALRFRWAAHGLVGSSPSIFEKVSGIVAQLLTLPKEAAPSQTMALFD